MTHNDAFNAPTIIMIIDSIYGVIAIPAMLKNAIAPINTATESPIIMM